MFNEIFPFCRKHETLRAQRHLVLHTPVSGAGDAAVVSRGPTEQSWWKGLIFMPTELPQNTATELLLSPSCLASLQKS